MNFLIFSIALFYVFYTPFTKVEESFNMQAMHDILYHRLNFSSYDHHEFPGPVPRSFIGPLAISLTISPLVALLTILNVNKFWTSYLVRLTLAAFVSFAWNRLKNTFQQKLGIDVGNWFLVITLTQFHFIFYMSRPLPNVMALPLVILAISSWLRREQWRFLIFAGASIIIFRSELVILLGLLLIYDLFYKRITIAQLLKIGVPTGVGLMALTIIIDSFFWRRFLWPEAEVFWFNAILNKSSEWGTSPFLWYFYSALPRALGVSLLFVPYGLYVEPRIRAIVISALVFIFLYSILPHKELRFIIYAFPLLNVSSACACQRLWINRNKSAPQTILALIALGHLLGNFLLTTFLLAVSGTNYPGGIAMSRLHRIAINEVNITIHIDNLTAQSGVTRFTEINSNWTYNKNEHLKAGDEELHKFDYLLAEVKSKYSPEMRLLQQTHDKIELIECFSNIGVHYASFLPLKIRTKPCIMILRKNPNGVLLKRYFATVPDEVNDDDNHLDTVNIEELEQKIEEVPKMVVLKRKRLITPKSKIKEIIQAERLEEQTQIFNSLSGEQLDDEGSAKSENENFENEDIEDSNNENIDNDEENIEENNQENTVDDVRDKLTDQLSKLDLSAFCDLTTMDTKECLRKILNENNEN